MKKIAALFITGLMLTIDLLSQSTPKNMIMNSTPAPGVYKATESITLLPGFSFTATLGNSLTLRIAPDTQFAQGIVTGYADGKKWIDDNHHYTYADFPSDAQLNRLTHVIACGGIGCRADGTLYTGVLPESWSGGTPPGNTWNNGNKNLWLESLVSRAHQKGVKVSIMLGGEHFSEATSTLWKLALFAVNVTNFVNLHGLDGVDVDFRLRLPLLTGNNASIF